MLVRKDFYTPGGDLSVQYLDVPFQYWLYALMTLINLFLSFFGVVSKSIEQATNIFAGEAANLIVRPDPSAKDNDDSHQKATQYIKDVLGARRPFGRIVGAIERQVYLYASVANIETLFSAILLFKAFFAWLEIKQKNPVKEGQLLSSDQGVQQLSLAKYYGYAIGNLLSLVWALIIFEVVRGIVFAEDSFAQLIIVY